MARPETLVPTNAFHPAFLAVLADRDQPAGASLAEHSGPWRVEETAGGRFAVVRAWESTADGDRPILVALSREEALLAVAALPGAGRPDLYRLVPTAGPDGTFALEREGETVAHLAVFDAELAVGLHALRAAAQNPEALAAFLEAVGHGPLETVGRLLARRLRAGGAVEPGGETA